ncbi:MAG TPA: hypothetical protein VHX90_02550 [Verrucomicrobiae bacterium]|nr:hypothetical protein [Verrucomicrobiae bacterium]
MENGFAHDDVSFSLCLNLLWHQAEQNRCCFLFAGLKNFLQILLRSDQFGLFVFLRGAVFVQRVVDLRSRRIVINRILQSFLFRAGCRAKTTATATATTATTAATTTTKPAAKPAGATRVTPRVQNFLNQRLNGSPIRVVGEAELIFDIVHHALLKRGRIKITATKSATASTTTGSVAAAKSATTAIIVLREHIARAQKKRAGDSARC